MKLFALILGGLGIYFFGSAGLRMTLQQFATRSFRVAIGRWTRLPGMTGLGGFLLGLIIESSAVVAVVLGGLITRGAVRMPLAQRLAAWSNVGLVVLVFVTTLDIATITHLIMGVAGLALAFNFFPRFRPAISVGFHLALILLGLRLMKEGLTGVPQMEWFQTMADHFGGLSLTALLLGVVLRVPVQSSTAVAIIGAILYEAKVFNEFQALLMIAGTGLGTGVALYLLTSHLRGEPRQIALYQGLINALAGGVAAILLTVGHYSGWTFMQDLLAFLSNDHHVRFAYAFLIQQLLCVGAGWAVCRFAPEFLSRFAPITVEQQLSKPQFIYDEAVRDPEVALDLAEKEEIRLFRATGHYFDKLREDTKGVAAVPYATAHQAALAVGVEIQEFLGAIAAQRLGKRHSKRVLLLERRLGLFHAIEEGAFQLAETLHGRKPSPSLVPMVSRFTEAATTLLLNAADVTESKDRYDIDILRKTTENKGDLLEKLRSEHLREDLEWEHGDRALLLQVATQFEHLVTLLHRLAIMMENHAESFSLTTNTKESHEQQS